MISGISRSFESEVDYGEFSSHKSTFVTDDLVQCRCCVSLVTRCAYDVHLAVGTTPRPTEHGFSGIPVRFLSRLWERRASLEKTLSLVMSPAIHAVTSRRIVFGSQVQKIAIGKASAGSGIVNYCFPRHSEENWRYRTLSKLETLFHVTNVTTVLNASVVSDRVSR